MTRAMSLSPYQLFLLDLACRPIDEAYGDQAFTYLVGSALTKRHPRDIDVRLIMDDETYDRLIPTPQLRTMLSFAFTAYLTAATDLPIDFGIQRRTEANALYPTMRNPLGGRRLSDWTGDASPGATDV